MTKQAKKETNWRGDNNRKQRKNMDKYFVGRKVKKEENLTDLAEKRKKS